MKQQPKHRDIDPNRGAPRFASFLERTALLAILLVALMLLYTSLISTNYIDPAQYSGQHILAKQDNLVLNLAVTAVVIALFRVLRVARLPRRFVIGAGILLLGALACAGITWSLLMRATPISDQQVLFSSALSLVKDDFVALQNAAS